MAKRISKSEYPSIKERYQAKVPVSLMAKEYEVSRATMYAVLREAGGRPRYKWVKNTYKERDNRSRLLERQKPRPEAVQARVPPRFTEIYAELGPVSVTRRVIPSVPRPSVEQMSSRNGRGRQPALKLRFPPLPGEPGYVYRAARA